MPEVLLAILAVLLAASIVLAAALTWRQVLTIKRQNAELAELRYQVFAPAESDSAAPDWRSEVL